MSDDEEDYHDEAGESSVALDPSKSRQELMASLFGSNSDSEDEDTELPQRNEMDSTQMEDSINEHDQYADGSSPGRGQSVDRGRQTDNTLAIELPELPRPPPGSEIFFVKLPNIFHVEPRPFSVDTYEDEELHEAIIDEEGRRKLKLRLENVIRWRYAKNANGQNTEEKESNTRLVQWSDGSWQMFLGSEAFDVLIQDISATKHGSDEKQNFHVFARDGTGLQCQARLRKKLTFKPVSLDSQSHRKLRLAIAQTSSQKDKSVKLINTEKDPELLQEEAERNLRSKERDLMRQEAKKRRKIDKLNINNLEDDLINDEPITQEAAESEEDEYQGNRVAKGTKRGREEEEEDAGGDESGEEEEEEEEEDRRGSRISTRAKKGKVVDEDEDED